MGKHEENVGREARTGLTGDGPRIPPTQQVPGGGDAHMGTRKSFYNRAFFQLPGAPTLKGETKARKVRGSIPQPCCPEKGKA